MSKSKMFLFAPLGLLALFSCSPDSEHSPTGPNLRLAQRIQCADECAITTDSRPFLLARSSRDSVAGTLALAEITLDGSSGATVSLGLAGSAQVLAALPRDMRILVTAGEETKSFAISQLTSARGAIYRFQTVGTVRIFYALSRGMPASIPLGDLRLTQYSNSAAIVKSVRRWVRQSSAFAAQMSSSSSCIIEAPTSRVCGTTVWVNPYAAAATYEGTFQSNPGTGASSTIGINFTPAVPSVTITVYDPTYDGNTAQAFDSTGALLGSVSFAGTGTPGWDVPDTKTLTFNGIHTLILTPAAADYVAYDANFEGTPGPSPCPHAVLNGSPTITDPYGALGRRSIPHMGRDYDGSIGTPILSEDAGVVAHSDSGKSSGWAIVVRSADATSYYFHMSHRSPFNVGDTVQGGTQVGTIGNTGHVESSTGGNGAHLHFEQHLPGGPVWDSTGHVPKGTQFEPCTTSGEHI